MTERQQKIKSVLTFTQALMQHALKMNKIDLQKRGGEYFVKFNKPKGRSLNPTPKQMQKIKAIHLERLFLRTNKQKGGGITPAMLFYKKEIGVIDWLEKPITYLDNARYKNNVSITK